MNQCADHFLDVNNLAKQLYFTLTLSKVFNSEINKESLTKLTICTKCYYLCNQVESMKEHFQSTHQEHKLFIGVCPMRIICIKCGRIFGCPNALMKSIIYSLPSFPTETPPIGFYNLGNSCYSNSVLIALSHCHPLVIASSISSFPHLKVFNIAATANRQFNQVFHAINPKFSPYEQEDAAEFLLYVLDIFSNDSKVKSLFNGSTKTHFICNKCKTHTEIEQSFTVLSVPLSQEGWKGKKKFIPKEYLARNYGKDLKFGELGDGSFENHLVSFVQHFSVSTLSLEKSLQSLFSPHFEINGNGKLKKNKDQPLSKCEKCHGDNQMVTTLETLPEILVIHLERFGKRWFGLGKMYQSVSFPEDDADFSQFMPPTVDSGPFLYSLVAVVVHNGYMSSGHYMCYARKFGTKKWYLFNDNEVNEVSRDEVLNSLAYILFYQKKPTKDVVKIRTNIAKMGEPWWAATPIKIFSDPKLWRKSIPSIRVPIEMLRKIEQRKKEEINRMELKNDVKKDSNKNDEEKANSNSIKNNEKTNQNDNTNNNNNNDENTNNDTHNNDNSNINNDKYNDENTNNDIHNNDNSNIKNNNNNDENTNNDTNNNDNSNTNNDANIKTDNDANIKTDNDTNNNDTTNTNTNNENTNNTTNDNDDANSNVNMTNQVHDSITAVYDRLAPILKDASDLAGDTVEREETELDLRERVVTFYPYSKSKICVTNSSAEMLWEFVAQKGPIPFMIKSEFGTICQAVGDEANIFVSNEIDLFENNHKQTDNYGNEENNEQTKSTEYNEQTKRNENNEQIKSTEYNGQEENNEQIKHNENNEQTKSTEYNEQTKHNENNEQIKHNENNEQIKHNENNEQIKHNENNEQIKHNENNEQIKHNENNEQIKHNENNEQIKSTESNDCTANEKQTVNNKNNEEKSDELEFEDIA